MTTTRYVRVAVFAPLRETFDYRIPPAFTGAVPAGTRVRVPFGSSRRVGVVVDELASSQLPAARIKPVDSVLDETPAIDAELLSLGRWAADYYHHPLGEVLETLLPAELRRGAAPRAAGERAWRLSDAGAAHLAAGGRIGPRQRTVLEAAQHGALTEARLETGAFDTRRVLQDLSRRGWLAPDTPPEPGPPVVADDRFLTPNAAQAAVLERLRAAVPGFRVALLHGITGSGKTELYLQLVRDTVRRGAQALVLIPEIGLTEQLVARFRERFGAAVAVMHSDLSERARALVWQRCRHGHAAILLGTRSAVWTPLPRLELVVVDEEHDLSFKQQEGFRYSARDVAVRRAQRRGIPIVLGSATPSFESLANCERGKYEYLELPVRAGGAALPEFKVIDVRGLPLHAGLSAPLQHAVEACAARGEQALLFLNRRGFAPITICHRCGWIASCSRCDARLVLHRAHRRLRCHHCGAERPLDAEFPGHACGALSDYVNLGVGTEQIESAFSGLFPQLRVVRIDRDSMRRRGAFETTIASIERGEFDILVGTQMIAKGHDFSRVTLVGIIDADSRLLANDFRAEERFVQTVLQVAGRAGRGARPGTVLLQTHHPQHPVFGDLARGDYLAFARRGLAERAVAELPPYQVLALVRAEATDPARPLRLLRGIAARLRPRLPAGVSLGGPIPALMEKRIGKFRANLLLSAPDRTRLASASAELLDVLSRDKEAKRVRWSLDIDAQEIL
jgi:primosomal protein N' (replication factor Y)